MNLHVTPARLRRRTYRPFLESLEDRLTPATLPAGFTESSIASGLTKPTAIEFSPQGLLFAAEQGGTLEVWQNGTRLQANFFRDTPLTVNATGERGLLGVAFDPDYASNRFVYVYYTATTPAVHNRVSRFTVNATGDLALAGSEAVILDLNNLSDATNHNGGALHFGLDDKLYVAVGDNNAGSNAQSLNNLLGKMLRIDAQNWAAGDPDSIIPADNPFFNTATGKNRAIWALGLRNPFTFSVQPGSGQIFINDVGEQTWEEINIGAAGANYGWPATEGPTSNPNFTAPLYAYQHSSGTPTGCAITGGAFYNPTTSQFPSEYVGDYFFADFCGNFIYRLNSPGNTPVRFAEDISAPVDLRVDAAGNLYYLARGNGQVFRIQYTADVPASVTQHPANQTILEGQPATFTVSADGTQPLSYQWQRDDGSGFVDIPDATSTSYTLPTTTQADSGAKFRVVVTNAFGSATSNAATLTVATDDLPAPVASWQFEETGGTTAADSAGTNTATLINGPTFVASGRTGGGNALSFDGVNDYARIPDAPALDGTQQITLSLWVNSANMNGTAIRTLLSKKTINGNNAYSVYFKGHRLYVEIVGANNRFVSKTFFVTNTWYHVAVTFNGSLPQGQRVRLYVNGSLDTVAGETSARIANYASNLFLGIYPANTKNRLVGKLDDIRIYRQALSQTQIQVVMDNAALSTAAVSSAPALDCGCSAHAFASTDASSGWWNDAGILVQGRLRSLKAALDIG